MAAALDQSEDAVATAVAAHVADCASCSDEWMRLQAVERLLDQARLAEAPDFLVDATMARIAHSNEIVAAPTLRWSEAGIIVLGSVAASMLLTFWLRSPAGPNVDLHLVAGLLQLGSGVAAAIAREPAAMASIQLCLACAVAALWFVSVVAPRTATIRRIV
jgi:hypothetical protein